MRLALKRYNLELQCKKEPLVHPSTDGAQTDFGEVHTLKRIDQEELIQSNAYSCPAIL